MDCEQVLSDFASPLGLPEKAIRFSIAHPDDVVPQFLEILRQSSDGEVLDDNEMRQIFLIVHVLGELGEKRAFGLLLELLSCEDAYVEDIFGDAKTETLPQILIATFDGDLGRVHEMIASAELDQFIRSAAFTLWTYLALTGVISRKNAHDYLADFPTAIGPPNGNYLWVDWAGAIACLQLEALTDNVLSAFADGRMGHRLYGISTLTPDDFHRDMEDAKNAPDRNEWIRTQGLRPFRSTIETLSRWTGFIEETNQSTSERETTYPRTQKNPYRDVGRNDPCPCGSGKKFKKCCI